MKSRASVAGHPVHPMLVPLPIGLWSFSFVCEVASLITGGGTWDTVASYAMGGGIVAALLPALPGILDLGTLPPSRARRIGIWHMAINLAIVVLYLLNFLWRRHETSAALGPFMLSMAGILLLAGSAWLGGEMVYVHGVAVEPAGEKRQGSR
jgi:uncharacterized membrane protein